MNENNSLKALTNPGDADDFFKIDDLPAFDPTATRSYSRGNALWLMEICRLVYREDGPSRKNFFQQNGLEEVQFFNARNTQGALTRGDGLAAPFGHLLERLRTLRNKLVEVLQTRGASLLETNHTPVNYTARIEKAGELS